MCANLVERCSFKAAWTAIKGSQKPAPCCRSTGEEILQGAVVGRLCGGCWCCRLGFAPSPYPVTEHRWYQEPPNQPPCCSIEALFWHTHQYTCKALETEPCRNASPVLLKEHQSGEECLGDTSPTPHSTPVGTSPRRSPMLDWGCHNVL